MFVWANQSHLYQAKANFKSLKEKFTKFEYKYSESQEAKNIKLEKKRLESKESKNFS